jgi:hypothetical protein
LPTVARLYLPQALLADGSSAIWDFHSDLPPGLLADEARLYLPQALLADGSSANRPGHHMTVVQSLHLTVGVSQKRTLVLDTLRRKRNFSDYSGKDIDDSSVENCITEARQLWKDVIEWRKKNRPELLPTHK